MSTKYSYNIDQDFPNGIVNTTRLHSEIQSSDITIALDYINTFQDLCDIWFKGGLSDTNLTTLSGVIANHTGAAPDVIVAPTMDDGRPLVRSDTRPLNTSTYFTCQGDTASGIGDGNELKWDFSDESITTISGPHTLSCGHKIESGYKAQVIDMTFLDPAYFKDGALYFFDAPWGAKCSMEIVVPSGTYYPNDTGSIPAVALGQPGNQMYSYASTDTAYYRYVNNHFMYGDCPMGDELNAEGAMVEALPVGWIVRGVISTPNSDTTSKGFASFEMYRARSVILEGDTP